MISTITFYLAIVLFLGSCIGYGFVFSKIYKNLKRREMKVILEKNSALLATFLLTFVLSLVTFTISFYTSDSSLVANPNPFDVVLSFFSVIGLGSSVGLFAIFFFFRYFVLKYDEKDKKFIQFALFVLGLCAVVFFFLVGIANGNYLAYPLCNAIYIGKHGIAFVNTHVAPAPFFLGGKADGGLTIALYAVFILLGGLGVYALCDHLMFKHYGHHGMVTTTFFIAFPMGIVGARLWYCILDISKCIEEGTVSVFVKNPIEILKVWNGGLGIMGGVMLGILSGVIVVAILKYVKKDPKFVGVSLLRMLDYIIPTILLAQAVGRLGNFFNCEVHGNEIPMESLGWLPYFIRANYAFDGAIPCTPGMVYLPLSLMETLTNLAGYFVLHFLFYRGMHQYHIEGSNLGFYFIWYGFTRVIMEPLRYGEYKYDFSYTFAWVLVYGGAAFVLLFALAKVLREKKLLLFKNSTWKEALLIDISAPKKIVLRNFIILVVAVLAITALALGLTLGLK